MKRNLVGKILGKIKIFVQDFVPIRTALTVRFFLFLVDKLRRKHPFKHANEKKTREDCCIGQVTFSKHILKEEYPGTEHGVA